MIIVDIRILLPVHNSYTDKLERKITYQYLCEWVCELFLGMYLINF